MRKKRIWRLAAFVERLLPEWFDMGVLQCGPVSAMKKISRGVKPRKCGAVACAIGWLPAALPGVCKWTEIGYVALIDYEKGDPLNFNAAEISLGLSTHESFFLFAARSYECPYRPSNAFVARRLRLFVKHNGNRRAVLTAERALPEI